jgi:hypothetical protein
VPEKYGSSNRPVRAVISGSMPLARRLLQASAVRRSCQTIALDTGRPVARSHSTTVSRWLVTPMAATSLARAPARASASRARELRRPDLVGVVLDPARLREDLAELLLAAGHRHAGMVEDDGA